MKTENINLKDFLKSFNEMHDYIYLNPKLNGIYQATLAFDKFLASEGKDFIISFVEFRKDFIASDREAAAFMLTLATYQ